MKPKKFSQTPGGIRFQDVSKSFQAHDPDVKVVLKWEFDSETRFTFEDNKTKAIAEIDRVVAIIKREIAQELAAIKKNNDDFGRGVPGVRFIF